MITAWAPGPGGRSFAAWATGVPSAATARAVAVTSFSGLGACMRLLTVRSRRSTGVDGESGSLFHAHRAGKGPARRLRGVSPTHSLTVSRHCVPHQVGQRGSSADRDFGSIGRDLVG